MTYVGSKGRARARFALGIVGVLALASCIGNPGTFTMTAGAPSEMRIKNSSGDVTFVLDIGQPACSDGLDTDNDFDVDFPTDAGCASAEDANERQAGTQPYEPTTLPLEIAGDGTITSNPTTLDVQPWEFCPIGGSTPICFIQTPTGTGGPQSGSIGPSGLTLPWPTTIEIDASAGTGDLPANCHIGPIVATLTGASYDEVTGVSDLTTPDVAIPAVTTCGLWNDAINGYLGLPAVGDATVSATILNAAGDPVVID